MDHLLRREWNNPNLLNSDLRSKGDASKESRYPIFMTLSLWVECSLARSHSTHSDRVTDIGYLLYWGSSI